MSCVAVSPHLDDAAFSASARLGMGDATVVTVFSAVPAADWPASWWDLLTGATSSHDRQLERRAEDAKAMDLLSARTIYLDELELLYRNGPPDLSGATDRLAEYFRDADEVWLPAAIGGHKDHVLTRDIGLRAAARAGRQEVVLYADFPYVVSQGWPPSLTGEPSQPFIDANFWLTYQLTQAGLDAGCLKPELARLNAQQRARKRQLIRAYRSQAPVLSLGAADLAACPAKLAYELLWRMAVPACRET
jgi:LmbE family N-acetylglucosaminyl deacetylase